MAEIGNQDGVDISTKHQKTGKPRATPGQPRVPLGSLPERLEILQAALATFINAGGIVSAFEIDKALVLKLEGVKFCHRCKNLFFCNDNHQCLPTAEAKHEQTEATQK